MKDENDASVAHCTAMDVCIGPDIVHSRLLLFILNDKYIQSKRV